MEDIQTNTNSNSMGAQGVVVDSANNIYITGSSTATPTVFNTKVFNSNQSSSNSNILPVASQTAGGYVAKFTQNGIFTYATSVAGFNPAQSRTLATTGNELFFTGAYTVSSNAVVEYDSNFAKYYSSNIVPTPAGSGSIATFKYQV